MLHRQVPGAQPIQLQEKVTYAGCAVQVNPMPDGGAVLLFILSTKVVEVPLDADAREEIGRKLLAPSVAVANWNGNGHG
jgi:hypothetical protein